MPNQRTPLSDCRESLKWFDRRIDKEKKSVQNKRMVLGLICEVYQKLLGF